MATAPDTTKSRAPVETQTGTALPAAWWEGLCCWLTDNLTNMEMTLERRVQGGEWKVECLSHPLQCVATHQAATGVQIISIAASIEDKPRIFEFAGPHSITLFKDPAGFPVRVEIANETEQLLLCFTGPIEPQTKQTSNSWGE